MGLWYSDFIAALTLYGYVLYIRFLMEFKPRMVRGRSPDFWSLWALALSSLPPFPNFRRSIVFASEFSITLQDGISGCSPGLVDIKTKVERCIYYNATFASMSTEPGEQPDVSPCIGGRRRYCRWSSASSCNCCFCRFGFFFCCKRVNRFLRIPLPCQLRRSHRKLPGAIEAYDN